MVAFIYYQINDNYASFLLSYYKIIIRGDHNDKNEWKQYGDDDRLIHEVILRTTER